MKTCMFAGHSDIPHGKIEFVKQRLREEIEQAISDGYNHFVCPFTDGTALYFAEIVAEIRRGNPTIGLEAAISHRERAHELLQDKTGNALLLACSIIGVHSEEYSDHAILNRNRFMSRFSQRIIAVYDERNTDDTVQAMRFAHILELEERIIEI